jgi:hypothetical protein
MSGMTWVFVRGHRSGRREELRRQAEEWRAVQLPDTVVRPAWTRLREEAIREALYGGAYPAPVFGPATPRPGSKEEQEEAQQIREEIFVQGLAAQRVRWGLVGSELML